MAQIIPSITSLPIDSSAAPSVEDIQDRLPSICVDYLSHDWSEEDVWASWRNMTRHKHEIANGVRLENASWRTWQKQRNKLKTISPETLNWLKDSDVTWLYGPLHTASVEPVRPLKVATADERLGIDRPNPDVNLKKPILKHRTLSEMLTIPMPSSPILESSSGNEDVDPLEDDSDRPILLQTKSDTNIMRNRGGLVPRKKSPPRHHNLGKTPPEEPLISPSESHSSNKKHISFNTFVEQCVAVDDPSLNQPQDDSDDEMLEMKPSSLSSSSRGSLHSRPSISRNSSSGSAEHLTIAKIAPTMLKTMHVPGGSTLQMVYAPPPEYQSPGLHQSDSMDFPSPQVDPHTGKWQEQDEDEYGSGLDYFGGPNLGGDEQKAGTSAQPIPTVHQAPAQPKWRQAPAQGQTQASTSPQADKIEPSSVSSTTSSSSSLNNITSPPQPGRSILKVRPPGQAPPPEPSSPPLAYFNYTPSAATGIGGMRGSGSYDVYGATGSPVTSPTGERGRGRTPSRDRLNDRSTSRGTSASSTASISSSSSRSPVESSGTSRKVQTPPQLDKVQEESQQLGAQEEKAQEKEAQDYVPDRSSTPTPHSSPQITFRPLKDTSPASLPHTSTSNAAPTRPADLPKADPPTSIPASTKFNSGARATIAHVGTNAQPTLSQPQPMEDDDGASIMGRAANIASTAKDLLGALWYGANEGQMPGQPGVNGQINGQVPGQGQRLGAAVGTGVPVKGAGGRKRSESG
ncbi:hypothetical protein IAT38_003317 [Cryptococcus sp. DSM 104549]